MHIGVVVVLDLAGHGHVIAGSTLSDARSARSSFTLFGHCACTSIALAHPFPYSGVGDIHYDQVRAVSIEIQAAPLSTLRNGRMQADVVRSK